MQKFLTAMVLVAMTHIGVSAEPALSQPNLTAPDLTALSETFPQLDIATIRPTPAAGWWELISQQGQVLYVSQEGTHLLAGELMDVRTGTSLTEDRRKQLRQATLEEIPTDLIRFPANQPKHEVVVVTDIDCGYCRRLHQQIADYNAAGISISYLLMPRTGLQGAAYEKAINAACADQPQQALTEAMAGQVIQASTCEHSIDQQFAAARKLGANSTPNLVLGDGSLVLGYLTPDQLLARLGQ